MRKIIFLAIIAQMFYGYTGSDKHQLNVKNKKKSKQVIVREVPVPYIPLVMIPIV